MCNWKAEKGFKGIYKTSCGSYHSGEMQEACPYCGDKIENHFNGSVIKDVLQPISSAIANIEEIFWEAIND